MVTMVTEQQEAGVEFDADDAQNSPGSLSYYWFDRCM